jgi:hypothetical protein
MKPMSVLPKTDYLKKVVTANVPEPSQNSPMVPENLKVADALRALKKFAQETEIETGDEDNAAQPTGAPGLLVKEPNALLKAVGEVPKQQVPNNPEVVAKSNITAPGQMPDGSQRSQLS